MPSIQRNRRKLFITHRVQILFVFYILFSLLIVATFLGWEVFIELIVSSFPEADKWVGNLRGFPMMVKVILLLLWGMFSFLLSYLYLDAKFIGIFYRMDDTFKAMKENESKTLEFRKGDQFSFLADSFNNMRRMFMDRIKKRRSMVSSLVEKIEKLPVNAPDSEIQNLIKEIDNELKR